MTDYTCALWYARYGHPRFELCETEEDAAEFAYQLEANGDGVLHGVQFADGRLMKGYDWELLHSVRRREDEEWRERMNQNASRRPVGKVKDPFSDSSLAVFDEVPSWLGKRP